MVRRINFAADRLSNSEMPGVQSIIRRMKAKGNLGPEAFVDTALELIGPQYVTELTRQELVTLATDAGELRWG